MRRICFFHLDSEKRAKFGKCDQIGIDQKTFRNGGEIAQKADKRASEELVH